MTATESYDPGEFPGARWWKFDFHSHTPASLDYGKGPEQKRLRKITPREWLLAYMRAGIDCVAVTDHNSGEWIDRLKEALDDLRSEPEYRPLHLFPGVELSVNGGVHLLALFDPDRSTRDVDRLIDVAKYEGTRGDANGVTSRSLVDVLDEAAEVGALAIPAHVDTENGLFAVVRGKCLEAVLCDRRNLVAMEIRSLAYQPPELYRTCACRWTSVLGSDSHHPSGGGEQRYPGSHFTWVKMGTPNLEGLRLALLDGSPLSIVRSDESRGDPNHRAQTRIDSIEISQARYCGRERPLTVRFSPWLTAIIGGRGSGKSTIVGFLRAAMRRDKELPEKLRDEYGRFLCVPKSRDDDGVLTADTAVTVTHRQDSDSYRIHWRQSASGPVLERRAEDGWTSTEPGEVAERFGVRIYSQRQVYELSAGDEGLLRVIDAATAVSRREWQAQWNDEEARFLRLRAQERELESVVSRETSTRTELDDVVRKIGLFEKTDHADVLRSFQRRQQQRRRVDELPPAVEALARRITDVADTTPVSDPDPSLFDPENPSDATLLKLLDGGRTNVDRIEARLRELAVAAREAAETFRTDVENSDWSRTARSTQEAYDRLVAKLVAEGAGDPSRYRELVQKRQLLEQGLERIAGERRTLEALRQQSATSLERLAELRHGLFGKRGEFLQAVLRDNAHVRIEAVAFGDPRAADRSLREVLGIGDKYRDDFLSETGERGCLVELFADLPDDAASRQEEFERRLRRLKDRFRAAARGQSDSSFGARCEKHLARLQPEQIDRLDAWFPEDGLEVTYSARGDGRKFQPIHQGSPGQRTAAILAFLLSHGDEPLVLDQPEDDLDNELIYDLVVEQFRESKHRRQVIVVTHNPNIVVNGDAELVVVMSHMNGECRVRTSECLQDPKVRQEICNVMEGGREALEKRYRRITAGTSDV